MSFNEEKILIHYLKEGNSKAFEKLFLKYWGKLYHFCKRILKDKEESENLVQSIFMEIWENKSRIDEEKSFSGYLFKIAKNKVYNAIRKKVNEQVYKDYILLNTIKHEPSVESEYYSKHLTLTLEKLIDKLPPRRKEIFLLSRNEGQTYREIAKNLNITENTVDTQIRSALDFLREELYKIIKD